ncbi:phage gp6-like head-tail connector protein [Lysinibacillus sp. Ag94]|uniref:phage gp6-like head-tail connector protein n=1 Tax=Lysinibacillus sp. Ag94 TaxID=2936682 RepID=UPI00200C7479|nr:phage gp6-like head-tail connector protein [Lysinibacillus sp. Ag94]UPW82731.1 phage gp6-like head-tail connector protein [Lysinibacillus sp. Ag94]
MDELLEQFKEHIHEDGEGDSSLSFYLRNARRYVKTATGAEQEYLVLMVAGIMYEYRVADDELQKALDAITPFIVQEAYNDAETPGQ